MANTSYLRYTVEPWVRDRLAERYGQGFDARVLPLAPGGAHEFDAVSLDGRIVASIKANSGLTSGGNHPTGPYAVAGRHAELWDIAPAPTYRMPTPLPTEIDRAIDAVALGGRRQLDYLLAAPAFEQGDLQPLARAGGLGERDLGGGLVSGTQ